jgi:hypothetical protein
MEGPFEQGPKDQTDRSAPGVFTVPCLSEIDDSQNLSRTMNNEDLAKYADRSTPVTRHAFLRIDFHWIHSFRGRTVSSA